MDTSAKILLVEDNKDLAFLTKDSLEMHGFTVEHETDGREALRKLQTYKYDICLLDIMLPQLDGFSIADAIRQENKELPILFLTARSLKDDRIKGLKLGADDYITKPFSMEELILKIEVFLKRSAFFEIKQHTDSIQIGRFTLSIQDCTLSCNGDETKLTQKEAELLKYFANHKDKTLPRGQILKDLWGKDDYFLGRSLDVFISRCRKYLKQDPDLEIKTIYKVGFKFTDKKKDYPD